jgi:UPF0716 protein FxsA
VFLAVLLLIVLMSVTELIVMFKVADAFGWLETLTVLLLISMLGAWLVKRQGLAIVARIQRELSGGTVPTKSVIDGLLLLAAGVLLFVPGFITDVVAIFLVFPPTRAALRGLLIRRYRSRLDVYKSTSFRGGRMWSSVVTDDDVIDAEVIDAEGRESPPKRDPSGELGP